MICGFIRALIVLALTVCSSVPPYFMGLVGSNEKAAHFMRWWGRAFIRIGGWSVEVRGMENLPEGSAVLVSNHQSLVDIPLLLTVFPRPVGFISKRELERIPLFGKAMAAAGNIFVERGNPQDARRMFGEAAERLLAGQLLVIFPEGRRTRDGQIGPFKTGAFRLALQTGVPVVPVFINGGYCVLPRGARRFRPGRLSVRVLPPLSAEEMAGGVKKQVALSVRERILAAASAAGGGTAG